MMMPANYSAIAENEMTYVVGGGLLEILGDNLPEVIHETKTLTTNIVNIIANSFVQDVVASTLGVMFGGKWLNGEKVAEAWSAKFVGNRDALNIGMSVIGNMAAVYQLATVPVKAYTKETVVKAF